MSGDLGCDLTFDEPGIGDQNAKAPLRGVPTPLLEFS